MNNNIAAVVSLFILCPALANPCYALDGASVEAGGGNGDGIEMWRIGADWDWKRRWFAGGNWHIGGYWDMQIGQWRGPGKAAITDFGVTPVFRLAQTQLSGISPYVEGAIGFHLISKTRFEPGRVFGTAFQFGDHIGVGARFGARGRYDLGLRFQHLSNGSIKKPNDGVNFVQVRFQCHFR